MVEENLGPFERGLLRLSIGKVNVCEYAESQNVEDFQAYHHRGFIKFLRRVMRIDEREEKKKARKQKRQDKRTTPMPGEQQTTAD
jgi:hypothetical protein